MLYKDIAKKLRFRINSDEFAIGDLLPTERQLMLEYQVSRVSIRKAIAELVTMNLIERKQGSGTYITRKEVVHQLVPLRSGLERSLDGEETLTSDVLEFAIICPECEIANRLKIKPTERVYRTKRIRKFNDRPQIIEESYMPVSLFPELNIRVLEGSKFEYIEKVMGLKIEGSFQEFLPVLPDKEQQQLLNLPAREPMLQITSVANLEDGTPIDYSITAIKSSEHRLGLYIPRQTGLSQFQR
jgi:DNA-binding GntR family transcriptional regulator